MAVMNRASEVVEERSFKLPAIIIAAIILSNTLLAVIVPLVGC